MIETLALLLAISHTLFLFPVALPIGHKVLIYLAIKKKPKWIAAHPEFKFHILLDKVMDYFCYILALGCASGIIYYSLIVPSPDKYLLVALMPFQVGAVGFLIFITLLHFRVAKKIPAPEVVSATLEDRRLSQYIPIWTLVPGYAALVAMIMYYVYAYFNGMIEADHTIRRLSELVVVSAILSGLLLYFLKRKYSEFEVIFGEGARKYEIWMGVGLLYYVVLFRFDRFSYDFLGDMLFRDAIVLPIICVILQLSLIYYMLQPKVKEILKNYGALLRGAT